MSDNKPIHVHCFDFSPEDNSGESLTLTTSFFKEDGNVYSEQDLTLQSYCNSASFNLSGTQLTPELLRQLANELDKARIEAEKSVSIFDIVSSLS